MRDGRSHRHPRRGSRGQSCLCKRKGLPSGWRSPSWAERRERVHSAGAYHHQVPVPRPARGGNGSGGQGTTAVHAPYGGMASLATDAAVHCGALGPTAAGPGLAVEAEKATGAGQAARTRSTSGGTTRALPRERRSEAQHRSVRDGFLYGAGAEDHSTKWRSNRTIPERKRGEPFTTCWADALGPGARKLGHDCRGCGYATHTNTDNAPPVWQWAGG